MSCKFFDTKQNKLGPMKKLFWLFNLLHHLKFVHWVAEKKNVYFIFNINLSIEISSILMILDGANRKETIFQGSTLSIKIVFQAKWRICNIRVEIK